MLVRWRTWARKKSSDWMIADYDIFKIWFRKNSGLCDALDVEVIEAAQGVAKVQKWKWTPRGWIKFF